MLREVEFTRMLVGNASYVLLVVSMMMTRMLMLRIVAIGSGVSGAGYAYFWLNDPVCTVWETVFTAVNVVQIAMITYRNMLARFNEDERVFYTQLVSELEPHQVRRLLRRGLWRDGEAGTRLICQGEVVPNLIFLKKGRTDVLVDGRRVGSCNAGSLIGEISIRSGVPATATVVATEPIRYLSLDRKGLHTIMKADPEIERAIDRVCQQSLEFKLIRMNNAVIDGAAAA
jgi:CRP-like cAMP-binding protein